jgi:hypothetical protein
MKEHKSNKGYANVSVGRPGKINQDEFYFSGKYCGVAASGSKKGSNPKLT